MTVDCWPPALIKVMETLEVAGYGAYLVGGAVRDLIRGVSPKDYDVTTDARPEAVKALFEKVYETGVRYGTQTVVVDGMPFEVTTFRSESDYDGRKPAAIVFTDSLKADLSRRDFTMNAIAVDRRGCVYDFFNGQAAISRGKVNFVGNAFDRIEEDRLRILRFVRFQRQLDFGTDEKIDFPIDLSPLSAERIRAEFDKILMTEKPSKGIKDLMALGLLQQFMPEITAMAGFDQQNPHHDKCLLTHTLCVLDALPKELPLRLAGLLHDVGKPETFSVDAEGIGHFYNHHRVGETLAETVLMRLKYDRKTIQTVKSLVHHHMLYYPKVDKKVAKRFLNKVGVDEVGYLLELMKADRIATKPPHILEDIEALQAFVTTVLDEAQTFSIKDLAVDGHDVIALGYRGRDIGQVLSGCLEAVIDEQVVNEKNALIEWVRSESEK